MFIYNIELGRETLIPKDLCQDHLPLSYRYYDPIIAIISENYISPRSSNKNYNLSLKSYLDEYWSTDIYISNSYFDFAQTESEFYQEQDIVIYRINLF